MPGGCLYVYFPVRNAATRMNVVRGVLINELFVYRQEEDAYFYYVPRLRVL